jgi:hypothetical protein
MGGKISADGWLYACGCACGIQLQRAVLRADHGGAVPEATGFGGPTGPLW